MILESNEVRIAAGQTVPGNTKWIQYTDPGVPEGKCLYVDVDTSAGGFKNTPHYFTSIGGDAYHWQTIGVTSIYEQTNSKFRVYIQRMDDQKITPADANYHSWHINWLGIEG